MTRFARAHGSKSSNSRVPEEATSWSVMKQQIEDNKVKHQNRKYADNIQRLELNKFSKSGVLTQSSKVWEKFDDCIEQNLFNCKDHTLKASENQSNNNKQIVEDRKDNFVKDTEKVNFASHNETTQFVKTRGNSFVVDCKETKQKEQDESCINKDIKKNKRYAENVISASVSTTNNSQPALEKNKICKKRRNINEISVTKSGFDVKASFGNDRKEFIKEKEVDNFNTEVANKKVKFNASENKSFKKFGSFGIESTNKKCTFNNSENKSFKPKYYDSRNQYAVNNIGKMNEASFQGFPVKKEDADRLHKLKKDLQANGVPRKTVLATVHAERRKAEKALARAKKTICYKCRQFGHSMADCPELEEPSGICFKCGSTEHSAKTCRVVQGDSFKFTRCFICQEQGHISKQCPDNPRGLYPKGGSCRICGDVTHLRSDCPSLVSKKEKSRITVGTVDDECIEGLDQEFVKIKKDNVVRKTGVVKF